MKTGRWITSMTISLAALSASVALAEVGMLDGADAFKNFTSTKSRAEVRADIDSVNAQQRPISNGIAISGNEIGARGVAGSRYSAGTREEVPNDLIQHRTMHKPNLPGDIYFGE